MEISIGPTPSVSQPRAAVEPANQDTLAKLAFRAALWRLIDFLTTARTRLLSGRLLVRRALALSFGRGVASVLSAVWVIVIAHRLTLDQFGEFSVALALIVILTSLSDFGLQFILARDIVDTGRIRRAVLDAVITRRLILGVAFAVVMVVLYEIATHDRSLAVPVVFSLSIVGAALYNPTITGYRATGNIRLEVISEVGSRAVVLLAGGLWVLAGGGIIAVAVAYSAVGVAVGVIDFVYVRSKSVAEPAGSPRPSLSLRAAAPFALATTVGAVYTRVDNYLVALLRGSAAAGIYGASYRFQDMNLLLAAALGQLALSEAAGQDPRTRLSTAKRVAAQSVLLALGPAIVFSLFAQPLLSFLFGARYGVAAPIVVVLMISTLPGAAAIAIQGLSGITDPRRFAAATAGSLVLNVVANLILIPPFAGLGAAWANVISQTFLAAAYYWALWRKTEELRASPSA
jgi:PST family polysaccharide transporter